MVRGIAGPPAGTEGFSERTSDPWTEKFWAGTINKVKALFHCCFLLSAGELWERLCSAGPGPRDRGKCRFKTELLSGTEGFSGSYGEGFALWAGSPGTGECALFKIELKRVYSSWNRGLGICLLNVEYYCKSLSVCKYLSICNIWIYVENLVCLCMCGHDYNCVILCVCCHSVCIYVIWWIYLVSVIQRICLD